MVGTRDRFLAYKVTHRESGKAYIGITTQLLAQRWRTHTRSSDTYIGRTVHKYGVKAFIVEHIASAFDIVSLRELEIVLIAQEGTMKPMGFNIHPGGKITKHTPETIQRMQAVQSARSPEWRANISKSLKGSKLSPDRIAKMKMKSVPQERRAKIAASLSGRQSSIITKVRQSKTLKSWWSARKAKVPNEQGILL